MATDSSAPDADASAEPAKSRLKRRLPAADRLAFTKHLDLLRAFVAASDFGTKPTRYSAVAGLMKLHIQSVSQVSPFFLEVGFLERTESGITPAPAVIDYVRSLEWNPTTAGRKLAPLVSGMWFWQALKPKLVFRAMSEQDAVETLALEAGATPEHKAHLRMLLEYLELAGIITRDNGQVAMTRSADSPVDEKPPPPPQAAQETIKPVKWRDGQSSQATTDGVINLHVDVQVSLADLRGWSPERIEKFFSGIAQVVAAQKENAE